MDARSVNIRPRSAPKTWDCQAQQGEHRGTEYQFAPGHLPGGGHSPVSDMYTQQTYATAAQSYYHLTQQTQVDRQKSTLSAQASPYLQNELTLATATLHLPTSNLTKTPAYRLLAPAAHSDQDNFAHSGLATTSAMNSSIRPYPNPLAAYVDPSLAPISARRLDGPMASGRTSGQPTRACSKEDRFGYSDTTKSLTSEIKALLQSQAEGPTNDFGDRYQKTAFIKRRKKFHSAVSASFYPQKTNNETPLDLNAAVTTVNLSSNKMTIASEVVSSGADKWLLPEGVDSIVDITDLIQVQMKMTGGGGVYHLRAMSTEYQDGLAAQRSGRTLVHSSDPMMQQET
ncbi:hypothetical protein I316_03806 [Kwoniella heveanensis BCC8398]|uniref:Uncharacterized protein n=1 Tax=Kwoniella heveanensis BCC8398 TaxID=1296120 RepID=A0A1B9GT97_9TREE|nr:hypothetical protein I316_03806 [Kwoniella heveanensis BCC8398]